MIKEAPRRYFPSRAMRRLVRLATLVVAVGVTTTRAEAQEGGSGSTPAAGCYHLVHGPWGTDLRAGIHLSPSQIPRALRLDTVRSDTSLPGEWFVARPLPADPPSQRVMRIWRPLAGDSVFITEDLSMVGFQIRAEVKEDGLQGIVTAVTDIIIADTPSEVSAPLVGRRIPCPPGNGAESSL